MAIDSVELLNLIDPTVARQKIAPPYFLHMIIAESLDSFLGDKNFTVDCRGHAGELAIEGLHGLSPR